MEPDPTPTAVTTSRIGGLDALRGLAALAVFVCHLAAYWGQLEIPHALRALLQVGAHGVDVFVVLSGFVLMVPLVGAGRALNVREFYGRRFWRILPAYWVALTVAAILAVGPTWDLVVARPATAWDVVVHYLGLQTVFVPTLGTINGSLWSISLELSLYLVFPLLVVLVHRVGGTALVVGSVLLCAAWGWLGAAVDLGGPTAGFIGDGHTLPMRLVQFVAGMVLAMILVGGERRGLVPSSRNRVVAVVAALAAGLVATAASTLDVPQGYNLSLWALSGATLVWVFALFGQTRAMRALDVPGTRAYSFYLLHQPIILLCAPVGVALPGPPWFVLVYGGAVCLLLAAAAAEALYRTVELPSHRFARRRYPRPVRRLDRADDRLTDSPAG